MIVIQATLRKDRSMRSYRINLSNRFERRPLNCDILALANLPTGLRPKGDA
jgi:hypothetical protein